MYLPPLWRKIQVGVKSRGETTLGPLLRGGGGPREHGGTHRGRLRPPSRFLRSYGDAPSMRALYTISRRMVVVKAQILLNNVSIFIKWFDYVNTTTKQRHRVTFDDPETLARKYKALLNAGVAGVGAWTIAATQRQDVKRTKWAADAMWKAVRSALK
jgi:spore germination protein YaaH